MLAVVEERKGAAFDQVLRHQADDGLIRIEVRLFPEDEDDGAEQHEGRDDSGNDPSLTAIVSRVADVLFGHSRIYHMLRTPVLSLG